MTFFSDLYQSSSGSQHALDLVGRSLYPVLAIVCANQDPAKLRRIRVVNPAKNNIASDWLLRAGAAPWEDEPLPAVGQTVLCLFVDGNETQGVYFPILNETNPPREKVDPVNDSNSRVPGDRTLRIDNNDTVSAGKRILIKNDNGASLELLESGAIALTSAFGQKIIVGGFSAQMPGVPTDIYIEGASDLNVDMGGKILRIQNAANVTIANKSVATIDALDSRGDALVTRGWT